MPLSEWKHFFGSTIRNPIGHDLFSRRVFFDIRELRGDAGLIAEIHSWLAEQLKMSDLLVPMLANDTLGNLPPLTFFSGLVVAFDGTERRDLDLVGTALHPISDAARVFALAAGDSALGTLDRLAAAATASPGDAQIFNDAADAYRIALYQQALAGAPRIDPSKLGRLDQRLLKTAFASILRLLELTTRRFITCP
jgi:CBS domain-containing protein